jgi:ABC-type amino acid transport substrate-binding protein
MTNRELRIANSRRLWVLGGVLVVVALGLAYFASSLVRGREDETWARIQERGVFTVATDASYPPFSSLDENGDLFGFDVDLAEAIGRRWGVGVAFENITYDALLAALISDRDDAVISAFVPQPERGKEIAYTPPYFVSGTVVVTRGEGISGEPAAWAQDKRLAVEYGAAGDALARQWAKRVPGITVLPRPTASEALLAVENGEADAAIVDLISAYDFLLGHPSLAIAGPPMEPEPYVIAVSVKSHVLRQAFERTLRDMQADGALTELRVKWFGEAAR